MWHAWGRRGKCTGFWWKSPNERDHSEDRGVDGRLGLERIFGRTAGSVWNGFSWFRLGSMASCCECGDETLGSGATDLVSQHHYWPCVRMFYYIYFMHLLYFLICILFSCADSLTGSYSCWVNTLKWINKFNWLKYKFYYNNKQ
jgi:hypothetical protein